MAITIEEVRSRQAEDAVLNIRLRVFEKELGIAIPKLELAPRPGALHLLARVGPDADPAGVLSIIDTTGDDELLSIHGVRPAPGAKVARYTQLAVLKPYRGLNIPIIMMLEAYSRFVVPQGVACTWLLFDADRAASSFLCRRLGFMPVKTSSFSEYGRTRALVRDETQPGAKLALMDAKRYVEESVKCLPIPPPAIASRSMSYRTK